MQYLMYSAIIEGINIGLPAFILKEFSRMNHLNCNYINIDQLSYFFDEYKYKEEYHLKIIILNLIYTKLQEIFMKILSRFNLTSIALPFLYEIAYGGAE